MSESTGSRASGPQTDRQMARYPRRRFCLYLLPIVACPLLLLTTAFVVVPTQWFALRSGNTYLANLGYGATLSHRNCQILIYGDSSAMVGVDPAILRQRTGLTACNIAEFAGMTVISRTLLVDTFLQHNPHPRYLVFLFTPEDLSIPNNWSTANVGTFEAISFRLEHTRNLQTALLLITHPSDTFGWAEQGLRLALEHLSSNPMPPATAHLRESFAGQLPVSGATLTECSAALYTRPPDPIWIDRLRTRYSINGTTVLVDATPTANCDPNLPFFRQHLDSLIDNSPYAPIPVSSFIEDSRLHANQSGVRLISDMIAGQIAARESPVPPFGGH
jgi:hypothetical protein